MLNESTKLKEIIKCIAIWTSRITLENSLSYFDINKDSEGLCVALLNLVYNYNLEDLNLDKVNYPGIDLGDEGVGIAFQVTSQRNLSKIRHTVSTFYDTNLNERFINGVRILILSTEKVNRRGIIKGYPNFNFGTHVIYLRDIIKEIRIIYRKDQARFILIEKLLKDKLASHLHSNGDLSLLDFRSAAQRVNYYLELFRSGTKSSFDKFIELTIICDSEEISSSDFYIKFKPRNYIVSGNSGYGKSMFSKICGYKISFNGIVPLFVEAKYYNSGLTNLIDKEVSKFEFPSGVNFFTHCAEAGYKILLIVDGLNECAADTGNVLLAELRELSCRYDVNYMVTLQETHNLELTQEETTVLISPPNHWQKNEIASLFTKHISNLSTVIEVVNTRLEAAILGDLAEDGVEDISRFDIFSLYVRKKLGREISGPLFFLNELANTMSQEITFSISLSRAERLLHTLNLSENTIEHCISSSILRKSFTNLSFSHEMFLDFFSANSFANSNMDDGELTVAFNKPKNYKNRIFIISALDDHDRNIVLDKINDSKLYLSLLSGEVGNICKDWAERRFEEVLKKVEREIPNITFKIGKEFFNHVSIDHDVIFKWTEQEMSILLAFTQTLSSEGCEKLLRLTRLMDNQITAEFRRLLDSAKEQGIGLRSGIFKTIYPIGFIKGESLPGLSIIFRHISPGYFHSENLLMGEALVLKYLNDPTLTPGQLYLLLKLNKYTENQKLFYKVINKNLTENWRFLAYDLKLEILEMAGRCYTHESERLGLIDVITVLHDEEQHMFLSNAFFDALKALDHFEEIDDYIGNVYSELEDILSMDDDQYGFQAAVSLINRQFDHPYSSTYYHVISELEESHAKKLYAKAVQFTGDSFLTTSLLLQADVILGSDCCPLIVNHAENPLRDSVMPFESLSAYVTVYFLLSKHKFSLEHLIFKDRDAVTKVIRACAEILYWLNRDDLSYDQILSNCATPGKALFIEHAPYTLDAIFEIQKSTQDLMRKVDHLIFTSFLSTFKTEIADAARTALKKPEEQMGIIKHFSKTKDIVLFAIDYLKRNGQPTDIHLLKNMADNPDYGAHAIEAVKALQKNGSNASH